MATINRISFDDVTKCNFKPEPHTVNLKKDKINGEWWGVIEDGKLVSVCCVFDRPHDKCFTRLYTPPEHRKHGYCTALIYYLSNSVYNGYRLVAHCLPQSVKCFMVSGFALSGIKHYKDGDFYFVRKESCYNGQTKERD